MDTQRLRSLAEQFSAVGVGGMFTPEQQRELCSLALEAADTLEQSLGASEGVPPKFHWLPVSELVELRNASIKYFYLRVCRMAEKNMALTGTVSGAHWNAMQQALAQMHISVEDSPQPDPLTGGTAEARQE